MVTGDVVNTASRIQSLAPAGSVYVGDSTRRATEQTIVYENAGSHELRGKVGSLSSLACPAGRVRRARLAEVAGAGGAVRRPQPGAAPDQGLLPRVRGRGQSAPRLGDGSRGHRQEPPLLGVLQVHGRASPTDLLAQGPLPLVRRGRHLLGAGGHGADALPDHGGRAGHIGRCEARGRPRRARARRGGAAVRRAAYGSPARPGGRTALRARRPVRSLEGVLRAARRRQSRGSGVRGHAVGGRLAARLHRLPARVHAQLAALRRDAGAARAAGQETDLGRRTPELHVDLPGAAHRGRDGSPPVRARPRPSRGGSPSDPAAGGRHPALRRRDRAHAARPRRARAGRSRLSADGDDRLSRRPGDAAGADRRPPGRVAAGRASPAAGRFGARQDVHEAGARSRCPASARTSSISCSAPWCARRSSASRPIRGRRSTASTASSRTSSATWPTRRCPRRSAARGTWPRPRISSPRSRRRRRSSRCSPPITSTPTTPPRTWRMPARSRSGRGRCSSGPGIGQPRWRRRARHNATSSRPRSSRDDQLPRADLHVRAARMAWRRARGEEARALFGQALSAFEAAGRERQAARVSARLAEIDFREGHPSHAVTRLEKAMETLSVEDPDEDLAAVAGQLGRFLVLDGRTKRPPHTSSDHSSSRRHSRFPRCSPSP